MGFKINTIHPSEALFSRQFLTLPMSSRWRGSIDTSDWMRNGDFANSRLDAEVDAALLVCRAKLQQHPESTVGVMTMGARYVDL